MIQIVTTTLNAARIAAPYLLKIAGTTAKNGAIIYGVTYGTKRSVTALVNKVERETRPATHITVVDTEKDAEIAEVLEEGADVIEIRIPRHTTLQNRLNYEAKFLAEAALFTAKNAGVPVVCFAVAEATVEFPAIAIPFYVAGFSWMAGNIVRQYYVSKDELREARSKMPQIRFHGAKIADVIRLHKDETPAEEAVKEEEGSEEAPEVVAVEIDMAQVRRYPGRSGRAFAMHYVTNKDLAREIRPQIEETLSSQSLEDRKVEQFMASFDKMVEEILSQGSNQQ